MRFNQDPQKRGGQMNKSFGPHLTAFADRSASGGLFHALSSLDQNDLVRPEKVIVCKAGYTDPRWPNEFPDA